MAAFLERQQIGIKDTTTKTTVPNNPVAKLMYYFNCVCTCIDDSDDSTFRRLRQYQSNYNSLSDEEEAMLLVLCLALSPDKLIDSVFFLSEDTGEFSNRFLELSAVSTKLIVSESLLIGGQRKRVQSIMLFQKSWLENNYLNPMKAYLERPNRGRAALPSPPRQTQSRPVYRPPTQQAPSYSSAPRQTAYYTPPAPQLQRTQPVRRAPASYPSYNEPRQKKKCAIM